MCGTLVLRHGGVSLLVEEHVQDGVDRAAGIVLLVDVDVADGDVVPTVPTVMSERPELVPEMFDALFVFACVVSSVVDVLSGAAAARLAVALRMSRITVALGGPRLMAC